jgi:hypothetical protein
MRTLRTLSPFAVVASVFVVVVACQPRTQDGAPPNGMPPTGYPAYPPGQTPPGYPPGQTPPGYPPPGATAPTGAPTTPMPAGSGQMAVPGPIAFQCKDDVPCGTHHCNVQYGKCAFPCQSAADCLQPNSCMAGLCVPLPAASH